MEESAKLSLNERCIIKYTSQIFVWKTCKWIKLALVWQVRWKWNYWCTNGSTIMLASCSKKQMQLEFMFSSLSEKRNQSKLPSRSCVVIQIPPPKSAMGSRSQGMEKQKFTRQLWRHWHEADSSGAQLSDWRPLLCSPVSLRIVIILTCRRVRNEAFGGGREEFFGKSEERRNLWFSHLQWQSQPCRRTKAKFHSDSLNCVLAGMSMGETQSKC